MRAYRLRSQKTTSLALRQQLAESGRLESLRGQLLREQTIGHLLGDTVLELCEQMNELVKAARAQRGVHFAEECSELLTLLYLCAPLERRKYCAAEHQHEDKPKQCPRRGSVLLALIEGFVGLFEGSGICAAESSYAGRPVEA